MPELTHNAIVYVLIPIIFGAYVYMWHSFNRLWDQRDKDIKSVTDALVGFNDRIDRIMELLVKGHGTRKDDE